jgi:lysophospholipase L1-like esterase
VESWSLLTFVLIFIAIGVALVALAMQRRALRLRDVARGLLITYVFIGVLLVGAELYLHYGFAQSENVYTLATGNWLERHWRENRLGYRDREWTAADLEGKTTVVVTGDSFTAGWGIENPDDRYTGELQRQLGDDYAVINLGVYGTATVEQLDRLKAFPLATPDVVILQYFLNDINYAGLRLGLLPDPRPAPEWTDESYLANFLYTRLLYRYLDPRYNEDWWQWSYDAYDNATIWDLHRGEIEDYIDYVESIDARLIVVIFPNMLDPVASIPYVDRVAQVFEERGQTDILKLFDAAAAWSPQERMVSTRDTHPSVAFHRYVGEELYRLYFADSE